MALKRSTRTMRLMFGEDDPLQGDGRRAGLRQLGFQVDWVRDGQDAERELRAQPFAAALLDLGLSMKDGLDLLASLRPEGLIVPVLVLTARDAVPDRIRGLDLGADDDVLKPVDLRALAARLRAQVQRAHGQAQDLPMDPAARSVLRACLPVALSQREFKLLQALKLNADHVLSREQLEQHLYSLGREVWRWSRWPGWPPP